MPKKKPKPPARRSHHLCFNLEEQAMLDADRASLPGVPPKIGGYLKHAALSYPKLRRLEEFVRQASTEHSDDINSAEVASSALRLAGL